MSDRDAADPLDHLPCPQPGCTGTIEDGYCDVCGLPPTLTLPPPGPPSAVTRPAGPGATSAGTSVTTAGASPVGPAVAGAAGPAGGAGGAGPAGPGGRPSAAGAVGDEMSVASRLTASNRLASAPIGSARVAGVAVTRRVATGSTRLRGRRLGAGLTSVPPVPVPDPRSEVLTDPVVPEHRRVCPSCGSPVGRAREGRPGRTSGFCPRCRNPYSFEPKLSPGELVGGQYQVVGCLAHGGLGWIYLAQDKNVSDRWVVLKGLLNSGDPDAYAAAVAERQFLAQVEHPLIVEIYNFVLHSGAGYIVMEYVGGTSLKDVLKQRMRAAGGVFDPVPVDQAIAYVLEVLPAFSYLHEAGLLYCDFKPDNLIQVRDAVKLIDLGGVRRIGDLDSPIYGTVGYQAPEVGRVGPSVASDIYTVGRTLAVLSMEFRGYQSTYAGSLPTVADTPLFQQHDSLYRLLAKACAPDPADRFASADELRVQLLGVLREVVAARRPVEAGPLDAGPSVLFAAPAVTGDTFDWPHLPALRVDPEDRLAGWLATLSVADPEQRIAALATVPAPSAEVRLALARTALEAGDGALVEQTVSQLLAEDPWEWRAVWVQGLAALAAGQEAQARSAFNAVYGQVPGELAPKLALALACERTGEDGVAESLYSVCARTDAAYVAPAAFGLARLRTARGDLDGALAALELVPATSRAYVAARQRRSQLLAGSGRGLPALAGALDAVAGVALPAPDRASLTVSVLLEASRLVERDGEQPALRLDGVPAVRPALRDALERAYRRQAALTDDRAQRVSLVEAANRVRRWSLR